MRILEKNRSHYKTKYHHSDCAFCESETIKDQEIKSLETQYWMVLACKYPYMDGNLMIIPKRHVTHTDKLKKEEWSDLPQAWLATQRLLGKAFKTTSFNLAMNLGPNSGGTVKHIHLMIVPRPKKKNLAAFNVFHDFYLVQMDYKELQKKLAKME